MRPIGCAAAQQILKCSSGLIPAQLGGGGGGVGYGSSWCRLGIVQRARVIYISNAVVAILHRRPSSGPAGLFVSIVFHSVALDQRR